MSRILIVDDDDWLSEYYQRLLENEGYQVDRAAHGLEAIDKIDRQLPEVIILDVFLPGPNGVVLLHELQSHSDLAGIPVILWSTSGADVPPESMRDYGVVSVLDKVTMQPEDVVAAVRKVLL